MNFLCRLFFHLFELPFVIIINFLMNSLKLLSRILLILLTTSVCILCIHQVLPVSVLYDFRCVTAVKWLWRLAQPLALLNLAVVLLIMLLLDRVVVLPHIVSLWELLVSIAVASVLRALSLALDEVLRLLVCIVISIVLLIITNDWRFDPFFTYILPRLCKRTSSFLTFGSVLATSASRGILEHLFVNNGLVCKRFVKFILVVVIVHYNLYLFYYI